MKRHRSCRLAALTAFTLLAAVTLSGVDPSRSGANTKLTKVTLGLPVPPSVGNMWFDLAKAQGWDREFGIDLTIQRATGSGAVTALVVGGGADIAGGVPDALINAVGQGQDLVSIWKLHPVGVPVFYVLGRKDAGVNDWKDLKGKKIGILGPASATKYSTDIMLFANGLDPAKDVEYVNLGGVGAYVEALRAKRVDAVGSWGDPNENVFKPSPLWPNLTPLPATLYQGDVYLAKRDWVTKNREVVVGFNAMLMKSMTFYLTHPEQAVDIARARIPELASADREKSIQSIIVSRPTRSLNGLIDPSDIQKYLPVAVKAGLIKGVDPSRFDAAKHFVNDYARDAVKRLYAKAEAPAGASVTRVTLSLPVPPSVGNMWLDVAKAQGWDKEVGIDLNMQRATGGGAATALVVGGGADIALGVPDALLNAVGQGQDLVSIWKLHPVGVPIFYVLGRKDAGIREWKDLKGKKIGILGPASATKYSTDIMLFANGLDPKDVEYVNLGGVGAYVEALRAKRVDAVGSWGDPNENVFKPSPLWPNLTPLPATLYQGDVYLAKRDWVAKHPDVATAFTAMLLKAMTFYLHHPEQAVDVAKAQVPELAATDREKGIQSIVVSRPTRSLNGLIDPGDVQKYLPTAVKAGLVKGVDPARLDAAKYFLNDYAKGAVSKVYAPFKG